MNMRQYEVEFSDGDWENMTANLIAENIISRVDDEGHEHLMMDEIVEYPNQGQDPNDIQLHT